MDYKKGLENALERARKRDSPFYRQAAEIIFPLLKENADEKILRIIKKALESYYDGKQHWVLFDDSSFVVQKSRVVKKETYYTTVNSSAMERFGSIHGFFQALTSKKDELITAGKMFVDCKVFTKEEIISMSKSSL